MAMALKKSSLFLFGFIIFLVTGLQLRWTNIDGQAFARAGGEGYGGEIIPREIGIAVSLAIGLYFYKQLESAKNLPIAFYVGIIIPILSVAWTIDTSRTVNSLLLLIITIAYSVLAIRIFGPPKAIKIFWVFCLSLLLMTAALAIIGDDHVLMQSIHAGAWRGLFNHKNVFAPFVVTIILLTAFGNHYIKLKPSYRIFVFSVCLFSLIMARSSTSIATLLASCGVAYLSMMPIKTRVMRIVTYVLFTVIGIVAIIPALSLLDLILGTFDRDITLTGRTLLWQAALPFTFQAPFGYGFGTSGGDIVAETMRYFSTSRIANSTHNVYITRALDVGWGGMIAMLLWIFPLLFVTKRDEHFATRRLVAALAALHLLGGMTEVAGLLYTSATSVALLLTTAALYAESRSPLPIEPTMDVSGDEMSAVPFSNGKFAD